MHALNAIRLSIMMFLQFFIWGAWYVTAYLFLGKIAFGGGEIGWTYFVGPIAAIISPLFVGMVADRFFATERVLGLLHLLGGLAMLGAASLMGTDPQPFTLALAAEPLVWDIPSVKMSEQAASPLVINLVFFLYMLFYFPTLALTNSLALNTMTNPEKEFPLIRVFGTIGWIVAGLVVSWQGWDAQVNLFYLAAGAALLMGLYSFTLPHTPPPALGQKVSVGELLGFDALVLLKKPSYFIFMFCSFLICIPLAFYYQMAAKYVDSAGLANPAMKMSFGQMSEIFFMLVMPLFFVRLGVKWMLFVGMLAWVVRYALFALGADDGVRWMVLTGIILHGICYDFFFVTGQIYTDKIAPSNIRGQAQGMLVLFTLGVGMLIGAQVAGRVESHFTAPNAEELNAEATALGEQIASLETADDQEAQGAKIAELREQRSDLKLKAAKWQTIWAIPAVGAALVMVFFALVFRDTTKEDEKPENPKMPEMQA